jgi:hypothetical protein
VACTVTGGRGERGRQPASGEQRRVDAVREVPQLLGGLPDVAAEFREQDPGLAGVVLGQFAGQAHLDRQGGEPLLGAVVEVALDPAPLGVGHGHDPGPRGLELGCLAVQLRGRGRHDGRQHGQHRLGPYPAGHAPGDAEVKHPGQRAHQRRQGQDGPGLRRGTAGGGGCPGAGERGGPGAGQLGHLVHADQPAEIRGPAHRQEFVSGPAGIDYRPGPGRRELTTPAA